MIDIKDCVQDIVEFEYFRDGALWYKTKNGDLFPVPVEDAGSATFKKQDKGIYFMRWMRKFNNA